MTKLVESILSMKAPARLTVPLHVCAISSWALGLYIGVERKDKGWRKGQRKRVYVRVHNSVSSYRTVDSEFNGSWLNEH